MGKDTFSRRVKEELSRVTIAGCPQALWETVALGRLLPSGRSLSGETLLLAEPFVIRRLYRLLKSGFGPVASLKIRIPETHARLKRGKVYASTDTGQTQLSASDILHQNSACRRAYLRGSFLARGSVSSPAKNHHLEMVFSTKRDALLVQSLIRLEGLKTGIVARRSSFVVYLKGGDRISEFLKLVGADQAVLHYENVRVGKSVKNFVQRVVNMDRANVSRAVEACLRQLDDIQVIDANYGLLKLPKGLQDIARFRLENPGLSMEELGQLLTPPVSKSAVNHRFRRIAAMADRVRTSQAGPKSTDTKRGL